ncbi:hypothetical protein [Diaphorobacter nitroreducens]
MSREAANRLLDFVRAGGHAPDSAVLFALWITGDLWTTESVDGY